jgi:hypothetical protein
LGIGPLLRETLPQEGGDAPHDTAVLAMTAQRLACPASQWAGDDHGLADDVYGPEAKALALAHRYRARDVLLRHLAALEPALFCRTAARFHADVDLLVWETTTRYCAIDDEDDDGEPWPTHDIPALRQRGHPQEGRAGNPQVVVVGLALTRDGLPGRSWVFPGHTADVSTSDDLKADVRGWRLNRCVCVGESGMFAEANRQRLSRALGRYILAVPLRKVTEVPLAVLTRAGRYRHVAHHRRVKAVYVGAGERRRRDGVCHNPDEAAREQAHREPLLELVRAELAARDGRQADHPQNACALMAARRFGRDLRMDAGGRLSLDRTQVGAEATDDGKCVVTTHDDTLDAEEVALGYTRLMLSEGCFRRMKTTGLHTRPLDHWRPHRIIAHVKLCGLALLRQRPAEIRCQQPWRTIRQTLDQ